MRVTMLGRDYMGAIGVQAPDLSKIALDVSLTDDTGEDSKSGGEDSKSGWDKFIDGLTWAIDKGTDTAISILEAKKAEATSSAEVARLDRIIEMKLAGLTPSEMKAEGGGMSETTTYLIGGGILVAGVVAVLAVTSKRRRRR